MTVQPVFSHPAPTSRPDERGPGSLPSAGLTTVLVGALLMLLSRTFQVGGSGIRIDGNSWAQVVIPALALPAALLWWARSPGSAQRLLPVVAGIALVPTALLLLVPAFLDVTPDIVVIALVMIGSAASWTSTALVLVCAASFARSGRIAAACLAAALLVLLTLLQPTVLAAMIALQPPSWVPAVLLLAAAAALVVGGFSHPRSAAGPVPTPTAIGALLGSLTIVVPSMVTVLVASSRGIRSFLGWNAGIGAALVVVAVVGAVLLGREALLLVLGVGLLVGCLLALTSSVGAGLGRDWWLPVVVAIVAAIAAAVSTARRAREVGLSAIALTVIVLVATFLVVEFGHLDEGLEIFLTFAGLVAGAIAGGSITGAAVPRLARSEDLVPVLLLALALGSGTTRLLGWAFSATDTTRNVSLLWISGALLVAAVVTALWPRPTAQPPTGAAAAVPHSSPAFDPGSGHGVAGINPSDDQPHGSARPAPPAW